MIVYIGLHVQNRFTCIYSCNISFYKIYTGKNLTGVAMEFATQDQKNAIQVQNV